MTPLLLTLLLLVFIFLGVDIMISLGVAGALGIMLFRGPDTLTLAITSFFGQVTTFELLALPLFVLMGHVLGKSPIGGDLFNTATRWFSWLPGGLAIASIGASQSLARATSPSARQFRLRLMLALARISGSPISRARATARSL